MKLTIGTRGSKLALTQTEYIKSLIQKAYPSWDIDIKIIKTSGDINKIDPIEKIGGKEIFVKEIERALLDKEIDLAVHSMKDMPGQLPEGLILGFTPTREDPGDVLVMKTGSTLSDLPKNPRIGTGSKRRSMQIQKLIPDSIIVPIRGNVETRIKKLESENLDGVILAAAGINRLGLNIENIYHFTLDEMLPSPAQGILAIEVREDDEKLLKALEILEDKDTKTQAILERKFLKAVGGSCSIPVGAFAEVKNQRVKFHGLLGTTDGETLIRNSIEGSINEDLGQILGEKMYNHLFKSKVDLVGAGPGDEDLITIKGLKAIENADVIVYDRLASNRLLDKAPKNCKMIYAGKKSKDHTMTQDEINEVLYQEAKEGKKVVRLKGGDPFVFGRGGEEVLYLRERGINVEVVPGITSPIGGLCYAGIPITHRGLANSFHIITGHRKNEESIDYSIYKDLEGTLVFLMGMASLKNITKGLIEAGKDKETPVAIVQWASTSMQKVVTGNLENIVEIVEREKISSPALIVVGEVVSLRNKLNFFERKPLFGKNIVITREEKRAKDTIEKFKNLGGNVISIPMIETVFTPSSELDRAIEKIDTFDYIYFTSVNGVEYFFKELFRKSDIRKIGSCKFLTVGIKTYRALEKFGIKADLMPEDFEGVVGSKLLKSHIKPEERVLVPRARLGRHEVVEVLKGHCEVEEVHIYDTINVSEEDSEITDVVNQLEGAYIVFTSSSTFENMYNILGDDFKEIVKSNKLVSIGPITSDSIRKVGLEPDIEAREYTIEGIIECIEEELNGIYKG